MTKEHLTANKNYMSSLAAEGVRNVVLASALYRQTVCHSEPSPAYSSVRYGQFKKTQQLMTNNLTENER